MARTSQAALSHALEDTLEDLAESIQDDAAMDRSGYAPRGYDDEKPYDDALLEAISELEDAVRMFPLDQLIEGNNLPVEAEGYSRWDLLDALHELRADNGGGRTRDFEDSDGAYSYKERFGGHVKKILPEGFPHYYVWREREDYESD
jgi:hypothetical protein